MANDRSRDPTDKLGAGIQQRLARAESTPLEATDETVKVIVRTHEGRLSDGIDHVESLGIEVEGSYGVELIATVPLGDIHAIASADAVRVVIEHDEPIELNVSEGVEVTNADLLHAIDLKGDGVTVAVIDGSFHLENEAYKDNVIGTIGNAHYTKDDFDDDDDDGDEHLGLHGTGAAEIVHDMAPEADLILASTDIGIYPVLDELEDEWSADIVTMSLGWSWNDRIDGLGNLSNRIAEFTDNTGAIFLTSAGNEANGNTYNMPYRDTNGNGIVEFDDAGTERFPIHLDPFWGLDDDETDSGTVFVHWDRDWSGGQEFIVRLWTDPSSTDPDDLVVEAQTDEPWERIRFDEDDVNTTPVYLEIEDVDGNGDEHFDLMRRGDISFSDSRPDRSFTRPAMGQDDYLLAIAAVQATTAGNYSEGELKGYSSRGPTQDGRRGIDFAAPSRVSLTEHGGFNGTSAASPHVAGALALLYGVGADRDEAIGALATTGRAIPDSTIDPPSADNTEIGFGYVDVRVARDVVEDIPVQLEEDWTFDTGSPLQHARPLVANGTVITAGLAESVHGLDRADGSEQWAVSRTGALSDSTPYRWNDTVFVGSGGGVLYAIDIATLDVDQLFSTDSAITSSPVVAEGAIPFLGTDLVIFGTNDGRVIAVDESDGSQEWSRDLGHPIFTDLATDDERVYLVTSAGRVVALDVDTGNVVWDYQTDPHSTYLPSAPTLHDGTLYVAAESIYAFDPSDGEVVWDTGTPASSGSKPVIDEGSGSLYVGASNGNVYGFDLADGTPVFNESFGIQTSVIAGVGPERLIVSTFDGEANLVDTRINVGEIVAVTDEPLKTRGEPVIDGTSIYLGAEDGHLYAYRGQPDDVDPDDLMGVL